MMMTVYHRIYYIVSSENYCQNRISWDSDFEISISDIHFDNESESDFTSYLSQ